MQTWDRPTDATPKGPNTKKLLAGVAAAAAALLALPAGTPSAQESATVMLLHGIPDTPVDLAVDGAVVIEGFEFR